MKIAIILAKSYSKRVPKKNFRMFNGKPMIHWIINAAKKSNIFDKIIIATDSDQIIKKFKKYNLDFIKRPKELNKEKYGIDEVMKYCLSNLSEKIDYACCLYASSPFTTYKDIKKGFFKIRTNKHKYVFAASNFSHPVERSFKLKNRKIKMFSKKYFNISSKFFSETYHDTGYFYWAKAMTWRKNYFNYNSKSSFVKIPNWRAQDIDTLDDYKKVNLIFKSLYKKNK